MKHVLVAAQTFQCRIPSLTYLEGNSIDVNLADEAVNEELSILICIMTGPRIRPEHILTFLPRSGFGYKLSV